MDRPEIVIGLVGALGTDLEQVSSVITTTLQEMSYQTIPIRLSQLLKEYPDPAPFEKPADNLPEEQRLDAMMTAGDALRNAMQRGDALALLSILKIREERASRNQPEHENAYDAPLHNHAFLLRSLKHPDEVQLLRRVYGPSFFLISAYTPKQQRLEHLAQRIARSRNRHRTDGIEAEALRLLERDEEEKGEAFGQQVRKTFWRGDAYVDTSNSSRLESSVRRILQIFFGHPFHTPSRDEYLMFCARAASYRSASLGRQVGAVIATKDGSVISTGTNEVPKAGGGQYWSDDADDERDHVQGYDSSDTMRRELLGDILQRLRLGKWLSEEHSGNINELVDSLMYGPHSIMKDSEFDALTEYQRPVHAEMSALIDAARRGVSVDGATIYTTTFPCHGCARHVIAAGIMRVVYIEPYAKSLARVLHSDSMTIEGNCVQGSKVQFEPFVGLAPRRYLDCFEMGERKDKRGNVVKWEPASALPRIGVWGSILSVTNECAVLLILEEFESKRNAAGNTQQEETSNGQNQLDDAPNRKGSEGRGDVA